MQRGYTLVELLVAVFLAVNILSGIVLAYTAAIRYLAQARTKYMGSAGVQIVLNLVGKELYNVACTDPDNLNCSDPNWIVVSPAVNTLESSNTRTLLGRIETPGGLSPDREFCIRYESSDNTARYCSGLPCSACLVANSQVIATGISDLIFSRPDNTTINARIDIKEKKPSGEEEANPRQYRGSFTIAYFQ